MKLTLIFTGLVALVAALPTFPDLIPVSTSDVSTADEISPEMADALWWKPEYECSFDAAYCYANRCGGVNKNPPCVDKCREEVRKEKPKLCGNHDFRFRNERPKPPTGMMPEVLNSRAEAEDENTVAWTKCEACGMRYSRCVGLAFVPGLPACEKVCRNRVKQQDPACESCDEQEWFPPFILQLPTIQHKRPE